MPQIIVDTSEEENETVIKLSKKWGLSKTHAIRKIIRDFEEDE